jgi:hypothetical protein
VSEAVLLRPTAQCHHPETGPVLSLKEVEFILKMVKLLNVVFSLN